jgi:CheY-like chemotaxis protein
MPAVPVISIVDDDALARDGIAALVESLGYNVITFTSAEHFLGSDVIAETTCLITDVQMPGLSGLELQEALQSQGHQTPVIVINRLPEQEAPNPCARKRSSRLPEQTVRRTNAGRMPECCDQVAIITGAAMVERGCYR